MFSAIAARHVADPLHRGAVEHATHRGTGGDPGGGPYVVLYLRVEGERIVKAGYECNGCPATVACSDFTAELLEGRTVEQALSITPKDLLLLIGGLPEGREAVAQLVVQSIQASLKEDKG